MTAIQGLSRGQRALLASKFLPLNDTEKVVEFDEHVFCGTYSQDGSMFMSSCQGASCGGHWARS
jgi:hypothetical protein